VGTHLFSEGSIKGITLKNRIVRSATWEGMCDGEGNPTERLIDLYRALCRGGVGHAVFPSLVASGTSCSVPVFTS